MKDKAAQQELFDLSHPQTAEAIRLHLIGDREGARRALETLLAHDPKNYYFHYLLGETKYAMGLLDEAADHYRAAIDLKPDFGVAFYKRGVCFYRLGQLENSLECFSALLKMKGQGHAMASYFFGLINQFLGNDEAAEEGFRILRGESRQSLIANYYLAQIKLKHNQHQEALELLEELLHATPNLAEVHYLKGMAFMAMHRNIDAVSSFRKTLELNPNDTRARGNLEMLTEVPEP
ncbi:MAG: tetratricopeptide repeat protein [Spirochaetia bacterium]|jgi:tetratricopeptide (TPR) repeat protein